MTTTKPTRRRAREPIAPDKRRRLLGLQRRIDAGKQAAHERAALMLDLYENDGHSYAQIAEVLGINHEAVRKAVLSRSPEGYPHQRS